ncbi:MAG: carbonic anhydrase [Cyanobacteria bacterium HKST-UBA06]|nr:carbonic anhydrase [Cyanobacteria bacterium HKST-UBA05]MCA9798747.1 carbonic anhydrase [Cyanobacteria bacterium HKST-UBA04]MCA9807401.1 carbonic anhydrase [Cyanobacteria bacterium HKST-UBA06]MCA9842300.1 carbonic anhydrase [Cyanobacteria bacterium HKST-UBA03]
MKKLIHGLHHFQKHVYNSKKELFERLKSGQEPDALFITCSDSRISPNLLTQTEPGEIFIIRNAGNIVPPHGAANGGEAATIEFAVKALGVKDIIICGHSDCGAIKGMLNPDSLSEMPHVANWLAHAEATCRIVHDNYSDLDDEDKLNVAIQENVLIQLENLRTLPCVASRLVKGDLNLHGWVYKIRTGEVYYYDRDESQFLPLEEAQVSASQQTNRHTTLPSI